MVELEFLEETDVFEKETNEYVTIPQGTVVKAEYTEEFGWIFEYNGKKCWQYNYSIEDIIKIKK